MPATVLNLSALSGAYLTYDCRLRVSNAIEVVGANTDTVPDTLLTVDFPPRVSPGNRTDGSWGPHEYTKLPQLFCEDSPYMAWIPITYEGTGLSHYIAETVIDLDKTASHFRCDSAWPSRGSLDPEILANFQAEVSDLYITVSEAIRRVGSYTSSARVRPPLRAVERMYASLLALRVNFLTRLDVLEYLSCLRRSVSELHGYLLWADGLVDRRASSSLAQRAGYLMRGVVCEDLKTYETMRLLGVPVWCFVEGLAGNAVATSSTRTAISSSYARWASSTLHNKALFFYPPVVDSIRDFESAARGYGPRLDRLHRDKGYRKDLGKMEEVYDRASKIRTQELEGLTREGNRGLLNISDARYAGMVAYNLNFSALLENFDLNPRNAAKKVKPESSKSSVGWERLWIQSRTDVPEWVLPCHPTWDTCVVETSTGPGFGSKALRPSDRAHMMHVLPLPSYFFHVRSAQKLLAYFFIWVTIRRYVVARHVQSGFASFDTALTAQSWRDVLSAVYFKSRNTKRTAQSGSLSDTPFDISRFWEFGGPLIFGSDDDPTTDKTPLCVDGTKLRPTDFESPRLRCFILWDLSILHCQVQLDRADVQLFDSSGVGPEELSKRTALRCVLFHPGGGNLSSSNSLWDNVNISVRKPWFARFQQILCGWPDFTTTMADLYLMDARAHSGGSLVEKDGMLNLDLISDRDYETVERALIYVYYCGVVDTFGRMPVVPFKRPTYVGDIQNFMSI